jgi:hypothetical protein
MSWKVFRILPVMNASGPDSSRSSARCVNIESVGVPSVLCRANVVWTATDENNLRARFSARGEFADVAYVVEEDGRGRVRAVALSTIAGELASQRRRRNDH